MKWVYRLTSCLNRPECRVLGQDGESKVTDVGWRWNCWVFVQCTHTLCIKVSRYRFNATQWVKERLHLTSYSPPRALCKYKLQTVDDGFEPSTYPSPKLLSSKKGFFSAWKRSRHEMKTPSPMPRVTRREEKEKKIIGLKQSKVAGAAQHRARTKIWSVRKASGADIRATGQTLPGQSRTVRAFSHTSKDAWLAWFAVLLSIVQNVSL